MAEIGLCGECAHVFRVVSDRGSQFYRCGLAAGDPAFRRYPVLPVRRCDGFAPANAMDAGPPPAGS